MKIKVCGMKYPENMEAIVKLQPDYLGLIFYEKSSRFFNGELPDIPNDITLTGVFVDHSLQEVTERIDRYDLDAVQLHGNESPQFCKELRSLKLEIEIIKVFSVGEHFDFERLMPYQGVCDYFLFDTKGKHPGGNGVRFDWNLLKDYSLKTPFFLSGGIGLDELEDIEEFARSEISRKCYAIDVNSKLELEPGLKDVEPTGTLIEKVKRIIT